MDGRERKLRKLHGSVAYVKVEFRFHFGLEVKPELKYAIPYREIGTLEGIERGILDIHFDKEGRRYELKNRLRNQRIGGVKLCYERTATM